MLLARGEYPGERCGRIAAEAARKRSSWSTGCVRRAHGKRCLTSRIELTGYGLEDAGTPGTAVDMAEPGVTSATDCTSEPGSASEPGKTGACGLYSGMCEPKSAAKLKKYAQEDGLEPDKILEHRYGIRRLRASVRKISYQEKSGAVRTACQQAHAIPETITIVPAVPVIPADAAVLADSSGGSASANAARIVSVTGDRRTGRHRFSKVMEIK